MFLNLTVRPHQLPRLFFRSNLLYSFTLIMIQLCIHSLSLFFLLITAMLIPGTQVSEEKRRESIHLTSFQSINLEVISYRFALTDNYTAMIFASNFHLNWHIPSSCATAPRQKYNPFSTVHPLHNQPLFSLQRTHKQKHTHLAHLGGWRETPSPQALSFLPSTPPWSFKIHSLTVEGIGHITSSPPHRTEALHLTLENVQASSTSSLRRGERFGLWDEGQRTVASLHAEELCCFWDRRRFFFKGVSLSIFDRKRRPLRIHPSV